jgi:hypothetical protein
MTTDQRLEYRCSVFPLTYLNSRSLEIHIRDSKSKEETLPEGERIHACRIPRTDRNPLQQGDAVDLGLNEQESAQEIQLEDSPDLLVPFQVYYV